MTKDECSIDGCTAKHFGKGLCNRHYMRLRRHGTTGTNEYIRRQVQEFMTEGDIVRIPLTRGKQAIIDASDLHLVRPHIWRALKSKGSWYAITGDGLYLHQLIMGSREGTDHRDRDGLNNRRANLRPCSQQENSRNRSFRKHSSRYKGVSWNARRNKWEAHIGHRGKVLWIGNYDVEEDAAVFYNVAAQLFHGEFASLNPV